jgi:hypothetical protein
MKSIFIFIDFSNKLSKWDHSIWITSSPHLPFLNYAYLHMMQWYSITYEPFHQFFLRITQYNMTPTHSRILTSMNTRTQTLPIWAPSIHLYYCCLLLELDYIHNSTSFCLHFNIIRNSIKFALLLNFHTLQIISPSVCNLIKSLLNTSQTY